MAAALALALAASVAAAWRPNGGGALRGRVAARPSVAALSAMALSYLQRPMARAAAPEEKAPLLVLQQSRHTLTKHVSNRPC